MSAPEAKATQDGPQREGGNLVSKAHQLAGRVFARVLKRHGVAQLNPAQGRILYELWRADGITQQELADRAKLDKSTVALMLDRLAAQGQIERRADARDARRRLIVLTELSQQQRAAWASASAEMVELYYRGLSPAQIDAFEATLGQIIANLEAAEP